MAALHGAVALAEPHRVAVGVGEDLDLDVAGPGEVLLEVRLGAAEVGLGLAGRRVERRLRVLGVVDDLHALAAAAVRGLDRDRPADLLAERDHVVDAADLLERAGHAGHAATVGGLAGRDLVAHDVDGVGRRADPGDAALGDRAGEVGVLGVEAVAGVHAVDAGPLDHVEDRVGVEVALGRGLAAERVRLVGVADVQRVAVELGVHRDRGDPELAAGAHHAHGDLAAVRDQDLLEQRSPPRRPFTERRILRAVPEPLAIPPEAPGGVRRRAVVRRARLHQPLPASTRPAPAPRPGVVAVADHQTAGAAGSGGRGSRRPARRCWRRCCCGRRCPPERRHLLVTAAGAGDGRGGRGHDRGRRGAEVAERPPRGRAQAVRGARRGRRRRAGGRARRERRVDRRARRPRRDRHGVQPRGRPADRRGGRCSTRSSARYADATRPTSPAPAPATRPPGHARATGPGRAAAA